jgi:hypothetical protein
MLECVVRREPLLRIKTHRFLWQEERRKKLVVLMMEGIGTGAESTTFVSVGWWNYKERIIRNRVGAAQQ